MIVPKTFEITNKIFFFFKKKKGLKIYSVYKF